MDLRFVTKLKQPNFLQRLHSILFPFYFYFIYVCPKNQRYSFPERITPSLKKLLLCVTVFTKQI